MGQADYREDSSCVSYTPMEKVFIDLKHDCHIDLNGSLFIGSSIEIENRLLRAKLICPRSFVLSGGCIDLLSGHEKPAGALRTPALRIS